MNPIRRAVPLLLALGPLIAQEPETAAPPSAIDRADKAARQGRHDAAIEILREAVAKGGAAEAERSFLSRILAWLGRDGEALAVLDQGLGLGSEDDDVSLQWEIGTIHRRLGDDGPFFRREGEMVAYLPRDEKVDEAAWRREHYRQALAAFEKVRARHPRNLRTLTLVGDLQAQLEQHEAALATWTAALELRPESVRALTGRARALFALGRAAEAVAASEEALRRWPRRAEIHALLAEHHAAAGDAEKAAQARRLASFYEWAPEFLGLDHADAEASFPLLAPRFEAEPSDEQWQRATEARNAEIERLLAEKSHTSSRLLAALCYHHGDHGELEDRMFTELEVRGGPSIPLLRGLLENAQTTCTTKGAAYALARLRAPGLLPILVDMLPGDVRPMFHADIARALAELGDPGAVEPLIELANLADTGDGQGDADGPMAGLGRTEARHRALLALGVLGGEAAEAALASGLEHPEFGRTCTLALYLARRDEELAGEVQAAILGSDRVQQHVMRAWLERFAPALAEKVREEKGK